MPVINILPVPLRNKIAAGEVVERPASVVKELIENSLDANSSSIMIDVLRAGKRLIRVSDNGAGMDREDSLLSFERYATSKIKNEEDLFNIKTMGFRGEALSSIAAVSKIKMMTAPQGSMGTCIEVIAGEVKEKKECPATGTTVEVKDIFFNTPARRKFLKSDSTENYHIIDIVTKEALAHFNTGFVLRMDGNDVLSLPPASSHRERLMQIFGRDFVGGLIHVEAENSQIRVKAFPGRPAILRNNKNNQFIFVNKRPVKDQALTAAVYKSYENLMPKDKHPVFFLFIEMNPDKVDFNVHPTKREVRFEDKKGVFDFVYQTLKTGIIKDAGGSMSQAEHKPEVRNRSAPGMAGYISEESSYFHPESRLKIPEAQISHIPDHAESISFIYLGETFVAFPHKNGLTLLDYHAAHERINYEMLLKKIEIIPYRFLFPHQVKLQAGEYRVIIENLPLLKEFGLVIEDFGYNTVIIREVPEIFKDADMNTLMSDIAAGLLSSEFSAAGAESGEGIEPLNSRKKILAARLACHSSIRGKEIPDRTKIAELLKNLDNAENPNCCPHGRPTRISISMNELKKMFKK